MTLDHSSGINRTVRQAPDEGEGVKWFCVLEDGYGRGRETALLPITGIAARHPGAHL